jgi:hypothetical protein
MRKRVEALPNIQINDPLRSLGPRLMPEIVRGSRTNLVSNPIEVR